jgi:hypothetical protein
MTKGDTSNNRSNWSHLKIIHKISNIPGKQEIKELQKTAALGTAHTLREVVTWKYKFFIMGNNITGTINLNHRTAATLYALEALFQAYHCK